MASAVRTCFQDFTSPPFLVTTKGAERRETARNLYSSLASFVGDFPVTKLRDPQESKQNIRDEVPSVLT
jgi:hypothetical protein